MKSVELLSPAGDMECLKSAVQCGANAVYFGAEEFNARVNGTNFGKEELKLAIEYAKLRNVKTHLTLNILIKNDEFEDALNLVTYAYKCGIDAIIVQDLGLAKKIIELYPDLEVHASTQMTIYNLDGVKKIEELGFSRCVLARELTLDEIKYICSNTSLDIEVFIHGALCICYSGQCLMSSLIGSRSGNRGKCAGTCRLPYTLLKDGKGVDKGYLLSSKDVCTLDILPELISSGVKSFKIEGRMKSKEYVGIVTSIYRKYIDLAQSGNKYIVDENDRKILMQIFNRGGFSTGFLNGKLGKEMMFKDRPNHIGIPVGKVISYNPNKGYVKLKLSDELCLGDSISILDSSCRISELMDGNNNIKSAATGKIVTIGRIKGKINAGDKVYKTVSEKLNNEIDLYISKENIKRKVNALIYLKENEKPKLELEDKESKIKASAEEEILVQKAENSGTSLDRIKEQLSKTGNTPFEMDNIDFVIDENIFIPISSLNNLRRSALELLEEEILKSFERKCNENIINNNKSVKEETSKNNENTKVSLCLNDVKDDINYCNLRNVDNVYIPFKFFITKKDIVSKICNKFNTYLLLPNITKGNYEKIIKDNIENILKLDLKGIVVSNLSHFKLLEELNISKNNNDKKLEVISNYTLNIANNETVNELEKLGVTKYIISPEADKEEIQSLSNNNIDICKEVIVYGRALLMTTEYCTIGTFKNCEAPCEKGKYKLKDRMGFEFPIYTDRTNCNNLIYNSKITSINWDDLNVDFIRIDILEETENEIQNIIDKHLKNERLEGENYTNGNLNRPI